MQICKILAPNCGGADTIEAIFTLTDASNNQGTVRLVGIKNALNIISDSNYLEIDGVNETTNLVTLFGNITVGKDF